MTFKPRILSIDDAAEVGRLLKLALEGTCNFVVEVETDPFRAVQRAQKFRPDLIFLDVAMPGLDGFAVARQLRAQPWLRYRPIIFFTGMDETEFWKKVADEGPTEFLLKGSPLKAIVEAASRAVPERLEQFKAEEALRLRCTSAAHC